MIKYNIISPVRNEEKFVEETIKSVINQTVLPREWILVNDGSTDRTEEIIKPYVEKHDWIKLVSLTDRGYYYPGTGVVEVVKKGFGTISSTDWDFLVKLDCDITIETNYFENILNEFIKNPRLGIASGGIYLIEGTKTTQEKSQSDHPWGASKVYRRKCFEDIKGWKPIPGWDLADLLSAQMNGWETRCFNQFRIYHYRGTGLRRTGLTSGRFLWGRFQYRYGYSLFYIFLKSIYWLPEKPYILGGASILTGYLYAAVTREKRLFDKDMRIFLRKKHRNYLMQKISVLFKKNKQQGQKK
ncbi:MAG: glycosyltransferase family 2 protein [Chlorobi bacterium]|nr:glycosyltransferase family 2 protein [Chlorobiota bacterium]